MGKRRITILIAVMTIAVTLLIVVQMNLINKAAKIKDDEFAQVVKQCLMHVAFSLESDEINQELTAMKAQRRSQQAAGNQQIGFINIQESSISFNMTRDEDGIFHGETHYSELDTTIDLALQNPKNYMLNELEETGQNYLTSFQNRDLIYEAKLNIQSKPIEERLDPQKLDAFLRQVFEMNNINLNYEYVVKSYNKGEEKTIFNSTDYKPNRRKEHQTPLFTGDYRSQKPVYLKVYFPRGQQDFMSNTGYMIAPTVLLVLLIIGVFAYTIMIILRQKKLSIVKNDFINNMTHELKTPISTISLASQMLRDTSVTSTASSIERISGVIFDESKRLSMQVEKVLQMAVFNEGRLKMKFKTFDLHDTISTVVQNFEIRVQSANGKITLEKNASLCTIYGDQVHITNVLFNLLDNAVKYSVDNPEINVSTENYNNQIKITVADHGIGIAKEHQKQVFERFFRVPTGNVHNVKGFGLGLHYVSKIVQAHNGSISVESALNKGTKFMIYFPIKE